MVTFGVLCRTDAYSSEGCVEKAEHQNDVGELDTPPREILHIRWDKLVGVDGGEQVVGHDNERNDADGEDGVRRFDDGSFLAGVLLEVAVVVVPPVIFEFLPPVSIATEGIVWNEDGTELVRLLPVEPWLRRFCYV